MDDKKAAEILLSLIKSHSLTNDEQEALRIAIGILGWTALGKSRLKAKKDKLDQSAKW